MSRLATIRRWFLLVLGACAGLLWGLVLAPEVAYRILLYLETTAEPDEWKLAGHPDQGIARLLGADAWDVYVETTGGQILVGHAHNCASRCWEETDSGKIVRDGGAGREILLGTGCSSRFEQIPMPPYPVVQCASVQTSIAVEFYGEAHYALLEDGNLWLWDHGAGRMSDEGMRSLQARLLGLCCSPLAGFAAGIGIVALFLRLHRGSPAAARRRNPG